MNIEGLEEATGREHGPELPVAGEIVVPCVVTWKSKLSAAGVLLMDATTCAAFSSLIITVIARYCCHY